MKLLHHTTDQELRPSLQQIGKWPLALSQLHQRLAPYFARPEPYHHALLYLQAILSEIPRKNGWQIAEHARQAGPYGIQRLLSRAVWDQDGVRDVLRTRMCQDLNASPAEAEPAEPTIIFPVVVLDESGFLKRGKHSAGVGHQHCGRTGHVENGQVG